MGTWGPGLYQNDTSEDVKQYFMDQLHRGKSSEQITRELLEESKDLLADSDEAFDFWCALADTQWKMGRLLPDVKEKALEWLAHEQTQEKWCGHSPKLIARRKQMLEELKIRLNSPQPPMKKVSQYRLYQCPWRLGDVFAFLLEGEAAKNAGLNH